MKQTRTRFERWLEGSLTKRSAELEKLLFAAIDAYDIILDENRLDAALLAPIVEAACDSHALLYENVPRFLGKLTAESPLARESVERMAVDSKSHVRFNAILCLRKETPPDFTLRLLQQGLRDKSSRVRTKAADWAGRLLVAELVPDLEAAFAKEKHETTKGTLEFELRLLRDGYILEPDEDDDDHFSITVRIPNGTRGGWVSRSELDQRGIQAIVAELTLERFCHHSEMY